MIPNARYVLPLRWREDTGWDELCAYLRKLSTWIAVTVVDGSDPAFFTTHAVGLPASVDHLPVGPWPGRNGKVAGVMTGVMAATEERLVIADDDVRYEEDQLSRVVRMLDAVDLVRPQNYFIPLPWHARWDTARTLVNRAFGGDYPGTLGVRRSRLLAAGGYDGDVLFENLELIRTIRSSGGRETVARDVFVARVPPSVDHFAGQRVRQAYDDFAQPARLVAELALLRVLFWAARRPARMAALGVASIAVA